MTDPRYPIGQYDHQGPVNDKLIQRWTADLGRLPEAMRSVVSGLSDKQLDTRYRDGGWTLRQVVHHVPDSHVNGYIRFKWALTEDFPTIKPYFEQRWAELPDARDLAIEPSLALLSSVHAKWLALLQTLSRDDLERHLVHPEIEGAVDLAWCLGLYAWHGCHHLAHITTTIERHGW